MSLNRMTKVMSLLLGAIFCFSLGSATAYAAAASGVGGVAAQIITNLPGLARLITSGSYVIGMALVVASIVKFKAHKDNPTQIPIGTPIALLFVGAALLFVPTVFLTAGRTLFGAGGVVGGVSGVTTFVSG